ncbi:MAG: MBOAT family protein [Mailhella sp.]|nr:MBOAT family protein [Mailhella sp.]
MNFITPSFLVFFVFALSLCRLTGNDRKRRIPALIACNLVFYSFAGIRALAVLLAVAFLAWGTGSAISRGLPKFVKKILAVLSAAILVAILFFFKYYELFVLGLDNLIRASGGPGVPEAVLEADIVYVAGISFFSFQAIAYVADIYREKSKAYSLPEVLAYISFFPTIMSGPIMRPGDFFPQKNLRKEKDGAAADAAVLILSGLFKKVVLSSYLSEHIVKGVFAAPGEYTSLAVLIGVYGYSMQIFCDFSGYTDLARGIGRLMGYQLPENFQSPYLSLSPQEFWRRWHMTLSFWLRDYVYITVGGSRTGNVYFNLWLTMAVGGLWHGSDLSFLIWGCMHGVLNALHRVWIKHIKPRFFKPAEIKHPSPGYVFLAWFLTFHAITLLWIPFRADNMESAHAVMSRLLDFSGCGEGFPWFCLVVIALGMIVQIIGPSLYKISVISLKRVPAVLLGLLLGAGAAAIMEMGPDGVLPFIYFGF